MELMLTTWPFVWQYSASQDPGKSSHWESCHPHFFQCEPFANPLIAFKTNAMLGLQGPGQPKTQSLFQAIAVRTSLPVL